MIDRKQLLTDLKPLLREMEADLRARCDEVPQINADLTKEYEQARAANRTGVAFEEWRADLITQVAVAWVLSSVFVRFLEDNELISPPRISGLLHGAGDGQGLMRARDERDLFFRSHPTETDRDYLLAVFDELAKLPGTKDVFGPHNPVSVYRDWLSGDAAQKLIEFFQKIDADGTGEIVHDFSIVKHEGTKTRREEEGQGNGDPTRFLGDLYQDLSEAARKKYALLQTPVFVEEFILERTLEPAIREFGLRGFKMIDPACGSGHFLLGSFSRVLGHWRRAEPGANDRELVNRALAAVHGVDLNPYAVAIARFRLLLAAMKECQVTQLKDAPNFQLNLACGDSLLHGAVAGEQLVMEYHVLAHHYQSEDAPALARLLSPRTYHAVVANPPYITVKDKALNREYRERYPEVCHMKYSVAVPFMARIFDLAHENGLTGQITASSFMKREFGKKLVESYLPRMDLTHVIDTSGAYVPGHGTPTVILLGRNRRPVVPTIRAVMGIKGEPSTPFDPAQGQVWTAIVKQIDQVGSQSAFVSVNDIPREQFGKHPWSIGGGGASELKETIDEKGQKRLGVMVNSIGFSSFTGNDDVFAVGQGPLLRVGTPCPFIRDFIFGEIVRDWVTASDVKALAPYDPALCPVSPGTATWGRPLWRCREILRNVHDFGGLRRLEIEEPWYAWYRWVPEKYLIPLSIVFAFVATHNHFVLDRGGNVFNRSAPVIKLPAHATKDDHLVLLGLLNSSTACFWMKQVMHNKGATSDKGVLQGDPEKFRFEFDGTKLSQFPIPDIAAEHRTRLLSLVRALSELGHQLSLFNFQDFIAACLATEVPLAELIHKRIVEREHSRSMMVRWQEELDWLCYELYDLIEPAFGARSLIYSCEPEQMPPLGAELRPYRLLIQNNTSSAATPIDGTRTDLILQHPHLKLIEVPEYKRRWFRSAGAYDDTNLDDLTLFERGAKGWLLDRLESLFDLDGRMQAKHHETKTLSQTGIEPPEQKPSSCLRAFVFNPALTSVAQVADLARQDKDFMQVAELYTGRADYDVANLVGDLIAAESVPCLPVLRYKPSGLDKRAAWERTWELQRLEDAVDALFEELNTKARRHEEIKNDKEIPSCLRAFVFKEIEDAVKYLTEAVEQNLNLTSELILKPATDAAKRARQRAVGDIPVPPKYTGADFLNGNFWRLRGKLDVPKERWVSFPHCEGGDGTLVIAWAGYDHLQLVRAIAERYEQAKELEGRKLVPLLACIGQLIPWLKQWHNELDPVFGTRMGDYFEDHLAEEAKALGMTVAEVMAWKPPEQPRRRGGRRRGTNGG